MIENTNTCWLWPDHNIGKRESRRLREEHNRMANEHHCLLEIERQLDALCNQMSAAGFVIPPNVRKAQTNLARIRVEMVKGGAK